MANRQGTRLVVSSFVMSVSTVFPAAPWYALKDRPGANFYEVERAFAADRAAREAEEARDLTALLQNHPELYEQEEDFRFRRWAGFVEPRVAPTGNLDLLRIGEAEALRFTALDGRPLPPMRGAWEPLGPFADGTQGAGRLNFIEFHPTDGNAYIAGSPGGGLWFTSDAGRNWTTTTDKIANLGATWAVYDPVDPAILYLGTGDGFASRDISSIGLLKSTDGGKTWNTTGLAYNVAAEMQIVKVAVDPANPQKVYVATSSGLQVSNDGAATFRTAAGISGKVWDIEFKPGQSSTVYASTTMFHRSTDGGVSFIRNGGLAAAGARMQIAVTAAEPEYVYALRGAQNSTQGVHRSVNSGETFALAGSGSLIGCDQTWYDYGFDAHPGKVGELIAGCLRMYRSGDGGANWEPAGSGYHVDIQDAHYRKDGTLFSANDGGVWRHAGDSTWTNLNNNLNIGQSYRLGVMPGDYDQICTGRQDNGTDIKGGAAAGFRQALGSDGFECFWNSAGTRWYGEAQEGGFSICDYGNGQSSGCVKSAPPAPGIWDTPWGPDPSDPAVVYAGRGSDLWRSADNGATWAKMGAMAGTGSIRHFVIAPSDARVIYVMKSSNVYRTGDGGGTWRNVTGTITGTPTYGAVASGDPDDVWITTSGYAPGAKVFRSRDGGKAWTNETGTGLPNLPANTVVVDDLGKNGVYVGMDVGVYFRRDGMDAWRNFSEGLPNVQIRELEIGRKGAGKGDRMLFAATYGRGVLRTRLWDDASSLARPEAKSPALRDFTATVSGTALTLRFRLGGDRFDRGRSVIRLDGLDGKTRFRAEVGNSGVYEQRIDVGGKGKGLYLFTLASGAARVSRKVMVD